MVYWALNILLIEGNPEYAALIQEMLTDFSNLQFSLEWVSDLQTGLERLNNHRFDLVLFDLSFPGENKLNIFHQVGIFGPQTPVIVLNDTDDDVLMQQLEDDGAADFLVKERFSKTELVRAIRYAVKLNSIKAQLEEETYFLNSLMENVTDYIYFKDTNGVYLKVNRALANFYGLDDPNQAQGKTDYDFYLEDNATLFTEDDQQIIKSGKPIIGKEEQKVDSNNCEIWHSTSKLPLYKNGNIIGIVGISRDITFHKQLEMNLEQEQKNLLRTLINSIPDPIFIKDINSRITICNNATALRMGAKSAEDLIGKTDDAFYLPEIAATYYHDEQEIIRNNQPLINQIEHNENKMGDSIWVSATKVPYYDHSGKIIGTVGITRDITEFRRVHDELNKSVVRLQKSIEETIQAIAKLLEGKDPYTAGHQLRVAQLACAIAKEMQFSTEQIDGIRVAATVHDIGKIFVPSEILNKPGRLSENELNLIKEHPQNGYEVLKTIDFPWPVATIVLQHHRRIDGSGYPAGIPGIDILPESKVVMVADVVEAMTSHRPYRPALGIEIGLEEIIKNKGKYYDSYVVDACIKLFREKGFQFK